MSKKNRMTIGSEENSKKYHSLLLRHFIKRLCSKWLENFSILNLLEKDIFFRGESHCFDRNGT